MYYLSIGAQRVQSWLTSTPQLVLLRGASAALAGATSETEVSRWLQAHEHHGVAVCAQAGEKDGVVVLESDAAEALSHAAPHLLRHLSGMLPRAEWEGWLSEGESYLDAYHRAETRSPATRRYRWVPQLYDVPVLAQCGGCGQEPRERSADGAESEGADCQTRRRYAGEARDLLRGVPGRWPHDFQELARKGGRAPGNPRDVRAVGRKDSSNHLALIKADGNKVGAVFRALDAHATDVPSLLESAVGDLNRATSDAVACATEAVTEANAAVKGALPHYVGGDDVLVSVPASSGWELVAALISHFADLRGTWTRRLEEGSAPADVKAEVAALIDQVSLGVGMVFAHETYPLADGFALADEALFAAKQAAGGSYSAVSWVDLTAEGMAGVRGSHGWQQTIGVWALTKELNARGQQDGDLTATVMALAPSARAQLGALMRDASSSGAAADAVKTWCRRRDEDVSSIKAAAESGDLGELGALLSRARWWPLATREEQE